MSFLEHIGCLCRCSGYVRYTYWSTSMLGAQALAMHDIPDGEIHIGVPARFYKLMKMN